MTNVNFVIQSPIDVGDFVVVQMEVAKDIPTYMVGIVTSIHVKPSLLDYCKGELFYTIECFSDEEVSTISYNNISKKEIMKVYKSDNIKRLLKIFDTPSYNNINTVESVEV